MGRTEEAALIGAVLLDNSKLMDISGYVTSEMFSDEVFSMLYNLVIASYRDEKEIDAVILAGKVKSEIYPQEIVSRAISECIDACTSSVFAEKYAEVVYKDYKARATTDLLNHFRADETMIDEELPKLIAKLESLDNHGVTQEFTLGDAVAQYSGKCFTEDRAQGVKIGISDIDAALLGLDPGDVCIIAARPSVGKSAFSMQIAKYMAKHEKKVTVFNLEMTNEQVYQRMIASESSIGLARIRRGINFLGDEKTLFGRGNDNLRQIGENMFLYDDVYTIAEMRRHLHKNKSDVAVIDYAQLIRAESQYKGNRTAEVGWVSRNIKQMAKQLGIPIILLCQLNRLSTMKDNSEPSMSELREAGDFEQDASQILLLWNVNDERTIKGWKLDKNRNGIISRGELAYDGSHMKFESYIPVEEGETPFG